MEELRPKVTEATVWRDRVIYGIVGIIALIYIVRISQDLLVEIANATPGQLAGIALRLFINIALWIGGGGMVLGFMLGVAKAYLRLENGQLIYSWYWWKWDHTRMLDLRRVSEARIDDQVTRYKGRARKLTGIMFTSKADPAPTGSSYVKKVEDEFFALPRGVTREEGEVFVQKINQEIKRVQSRRW